MSQYRIIAIVLLMAAFTSSAAEGYFLVPGFGTIGYIIAGVDFITLTGASLFLWNKTS